MQKHSAISKLLHRVYLNNYFVSKATLDYELDKYKQKIDALEVENIVFVSGLARSGTTYFLNKIHSTNKIASLQYNNMPFLFLPNTWVNTNKGETVERAHKDGIKVNRTSPEALDEYFWKVFFDDAYIKPNYLEPHDIDENLISKYLEYIKLICISKDKTSYITKSNNNILRVNSLNKLKNSTFFFLVRKPLQHAYSLLKLHKQFSKSQRYDKFSLHYFNALGHHEFGLNHKPFRLDESIFNEIKTMQPNKINYWLSVWKQYYSYLLSIYNQEYNIILFEDLVDDKARVFKFISTILGFEIPVSSHKFNPDTYQTLDSALLDDCNQIYNQLVSKVKY
jgi:hypothetical protein